MGEVGIIMSSEETMEMMFEKEEQEIEMEMKKEISSSKSVIRWENFLPRMFIRVLLVEADDSTRQIISALLKKCGYRVTAVCDGSKAWDILHGTSHNIDIVLTEVELPSKSGFSLLSMITDNESCKNIPVIMMSTHDSIGVVFKCMIKGASDFLIKPVRKNELRNLWQHVWRKHNSSSSSNGVQGGSCPQQNVGVLSENNTVSNTSDSRASTRNNKECSDKESDAQSSSIKPDVEAGIAYINETDCMVVEEDHISERQTSPSKKGENAHCQTKNGDNEQIEPRREAIDLIGSFDDRQRTCCVVREVFSNDSKTYSDSIDTTNKFDLSLRRSEHSDFGYQQTDERRALKRSNFSAFSPYNNSMVHPLYASNNLSNQSLIDRPSQAMTSFPSPQLGFFPIPNQDKGTSFDSFNSGFGPPFPHILSTQSCSSLLWNQNSVSHQKSAIVDNLSSQSNSESENFEHFRELHDPNDGICTDQLTHEQPNSDADYAENRASVAPNTEQSRTSSLCNGASSHVNRNGCGTIHVNVAKDEGLLVHGGLRGMDPLRFTQREIALNKFRLKRKERCFEKKVRYQSRKKLAEQRPRVKGQFVRQAI